jgi:hypothetical protein
MGQTWGAPYPASMTQPYVVVKGGPWVSVPASAST